MSYSSEIKQEMPFPLTCWKLNNHFSTIQPFSVCEVFISSRSSTVRGVMFACMVTILMKTAWFYCRWLQNDDALNSVQFFLDHSVQ